MTDTDRALVALLNSVTMLPATPDKRFRRFLQGAAAPGVTILLSECQRWYLHRLIWKYRGQILGRERAKALERVT